MKETFLAIKLFVSIIAVLIFLCGVVLAAIGGYDLVTVFSYIGSDGHKVTTSMALGLLRAVDAFLVAVVFFVLALGMLILFSNPENKFPAILPEWLRIKKFIELKAILWESILTTLVVAYLARLAERAIEEKELTIKSLIIPGGVFLIALSLFLLKKGEK